MQHDHLPLALDGIARVAILATSFLLVKIVLQSLIQKTPSLVCFGQAFCHSDEKSN